MLISLDRDNVYINPDYIISMILLEHGSKWILTATLITKEVLPIKEFNDFQEAELFLSKFTTEVNNISRGK